MIVSNAIGLIMTVIALAVALGVGAVVGMDDEGPLMMLAGPLLATMDFAYRMTSLDGHIYIPNKGGSLFFLPAWAFGVLWLVLGIFDTVQGGA